jgi:hypothetical protein
MNGALIDWPTLDCYVDEETNELVILSEWWPNMVDKFRLRVAIPSGCCPHPEWSVDRKEVVEIHVYKKITVKSDPNFRVQRNIPRERGSKNGLEIGPTPRQKATAKKAPLKSCLRVRLETPPVPIPSNCLPCHQHPCGPTGDDDDDRDAFRRSTIAKGEFTDAKCNFDWGVSTAGRKELGLIAEFCQKILHGHGVTEGPRTKKSVSWGDGFSLESSAVSRRLTAPLRRQVRTMISDIGDILCEKVYKSNGSYDGLLLQDMPLFSAQRNMVATLMKGKMNGS